MVKQVVVERADGSRSVGLDFEDEEDMARQSFKDETDINMILDRHIRSGIAPLAPSDLNFADVSEVPDFQGAQQVLIDAGEAFFRLPAKVRARYDNDPSRFVDALSEEGELDFLRREKILLPEESPTEPQAEPQAEPLAEPISEPVG